MLCESCNTALRSPKFSNVSSFNVALHLKDLIPFHTGFSSFKAALDAGCGLCRRLHHGVLSRPSRKSQIFAGFELQDEVDPASLLVRYRLSSETQDQNLLTFFAHFQAKKAGRLVEDHCYEGLFRAPEQTPSQVFSLIEAENGVHTKSMDILSSWIENCQNNHAACHRNQASTPKRRFARILDVEYFTDSIDIKLCPSDQLPSTVKWITLSHCWGGASSTIPSLTINRYNNYLQRIAFSALPRTFQDAISLARRLAIRYVWIDSLCIIQDSKADWFDQAAVMGEVYRGAFLNVAATKADNPHGGLFTTRDQILNTPLRISVPLGPSFEKSPDRQWSQSFSEIGENVQLKLEDGKVLVIDAILEEDRFSEFCINLDTCLGNDDGSFDTEGHDFSLSSRGIHLKERTLYAYLMTVGKVWKLCSIDLIELVKLPSVAPKVKLRRTEHGGPRVFYDVGSNYYNMWSREVVRSTLCLRAWVMQERLLAPRVVHFARNQLFWECVESRAVEERFELDIDIRQDVARQSRVDFKSWDLFSQDLVEQPISRALGRNYIWSSLKALYDSDSLPLTKKDLDLDLDKFRHAQQLCYGNSDWLPTHPLITFWSIIVTTYNSTRLTFSEDRLIAIAGLARVLSERTGIRYVAGLWMHQLPRQLLWSYIFGDISVREYDKSVAPTWSWAALQGQMSLRGIKLEAKLESKGAMDLIQILSVSIQGVAADDTMPFGQVRSGRLRVRGRLLPISLDMGLWPQGIAHREKELVQFWLGTTPKAPVGEVFLVPVLFTRWYDELPSSTPNSLLLESTAQRGIFRRIGVARLSSLYPLRTIVPQLYNAHPVRNENDIDEYESEEEEEDTASNPVASTPPPVQPNPQQQWANQKIDTYLGVSNSRRLNIAEKKMEAQIAAMRPGANSQKQVLAKRKVLNLAHSVTSGISSQMPYEKSTRNMIQRLALAQKPETSSSLQNRKDTFVLEPKEAVARHYYLDYVEDDAVVTFGHFVFEII